VADHTIKTGTKTEKLISLFILNIFYSNMLCACNATLVDLAEDLQVYRNDRLEVSAQARLPKPWFISMVFHQYHH